MTLAQILGPAATTLSPALATPAFHVSQTRNKTALSPAVVLLF